MDDRVRSWGALGIGTEREHDWEAGPDCGYHKHKVVAEDAGSNSMGQDALGMVVVEMPFSTVEDMNLGEGKEDANDSQ